MEITISFAFAAFPAEERVVFPTPVAAKFERSANLHLSAGSVGNAE